MSITEQLRESLYDWTIKYYLPVVEENKRLKVELEQAEKDRLRYRNMAQFYQSKVLKARKRGLDV